MNKKQTVIIFPIVIVILSILISLVFVFKNDSTNDQNTIKNEKNTENTENKEKRNKYKFKMAYKWISIVIAYTDNELDEVYDYSCDYYKGIGIDVNCNDRNDYLEYIEQCKNKGFTYDIKSSNVKNGGLGYSSFLVHTIRMGYIYWLYMMMVILFMKMAIIPIKIIL